MREYYKKGGKAKKSKSRVNEAGNYTKPGLRKRIFNRIKAGGKGGKPGQWSARKAQLLASQYKKAGGPSLASPAPKAKKPRVSVTFLRKPLSLYPTKSMPRLRGKNAQILRKASNIQSNPRRLPRRQRGIESNAPVLQVGRQGQQKVHVVQQAKANAQPR